MSRFPFFLIPLLLALSACQSKGPSQNTEDEGGGFWLRRSLLLSTEENRLAQQEQTRSRTSVSSPMVREINVHERARSHEINSIYFASGSADLDSAAENRLRDHAQKLKQNPKMILALVGFTDEGGSEAYGLAMSAQRVEVVYRALRSMGVSANQLQRLGGGNLKDLPICKTLECRQGMRRVDLVYQSRRAS